MSGKSFGRKSGEIYQVNNLGSSTKTPWLCEEEVSYGCESSKKIQSCKGSDSDTVDSFCRCHALFHRGRFSWETDEQRIGIFFAHVHIFGLYVPPADSLSDHLLYIWTSSKSSTQQEVTLKNIVKKPGKSRKTIDFSGYICYTYWVGYHTY